MRKSRIVAVERPRMSATPDGALTCCIVTVSTSFESHGHPVASVPRLVATKSGDSVTIVTTHEAFNEYGRSTRGKRLLNDS